MNVILNSNMVIKDTNKHYKVLIVEDEESPRDYLKTIIKKLGFTLVGLAASYDEAIACAEKEFPDVALCDIKLYDYKDGVDVAHKLKDMGEVSIVFLTAFSDLQTREKALAVNPASYLLKDQINDVILDIHLQIALKNLSGRETQESKVSNGKLFAWDRGVYHIIETKDILYIQANNTTCLIYTRKNIYDVNQKFGAIVSNLQANGILQVGKSYAVNLNNIISFDKGFTFLEIDLEEVNEKVKSKIQRVINVSKSFKKELKNKLQF